MSQFIPSFIIAYSNSDFTNPHEVVLPDEPIDCTADYTHMGVKYWGLETHRHRACQIDPVKEKIYYDHHAFNWVKIGFKSRSVLTSLKVSTKWFTGNQVRAISVILIDELRGTEEEVLTRTALAPDQEHQFSFTPTTATECLIKLYYEGGISRINFLGELAEEQLPLRDNVLEKAAISHVSNDHYGHPEMAVHGCRAEMYMRGWESARTGFGECAVFQLAEAIRVKEIVVDTYLHRLNAPLSCHVFGLLLDDQTSLKDAWAHCPKWMLQFEDGHTVVPEDFAAYMLEQKYLEEKVSNPSRFEISLHKADNSPWQTMLPFERLRPDTYHRFSVFEHSGPFSHLLYMHYPNGGVHGLKVFANTET